jgi:hypothetical protein
MKKLSALILVVSCMMAQAVTYYAPFYLPASGAGSSLLPDVTNGLVSRWDLDEETGTTAADSVGPNSGEYINGHISQFGFVGLSSYFLSNAVTPPSQFVSVPDSASLKFGVSNFTLSAWEYSATGSQSGLLIGKIDAAHNYWMGMLSGIANFSTEGNLVTNSIGVSDGQWHNLVGVSSNGVLTVWVDGVKGPSISYGISNVSPANILAIGQFGNLTNTFPFWGGIDDVRIYNRALLPNDISNLFAYHTYNAVISPGNDALLLTAQLNTNKTKLIQYYGGNGEDYTATLVDMSKRACVYSLLTNGFAMLSDSAGTTAWGNPASQVISSNAFVWATGLHFYTNIGGWGQSMGGLRGATLSTKNSRFVNSYYTYGAVNLGWMYSNSIFTAQIETAYSFSGSANYAAATAGSDPITLATNGFGAKNIRMIASPADTIVSYTNNSMAFTNKVRWAVLTNSVGDHGDASNFNPPDMINFFNRPAP